MREEKIHDALNLLDDDLIGEVEFLRSRKKSDSRKWMSWAAMAACVCIVMGSVYAGFLGGMKSFDAGTEGSAMEGIQENQNVGGLVEDQENAAIAENGEHKDKIEEEGMKEVPAFLVKIEAWEEKGFFGTIVGIEDTEIYRVGTGVYVDVEAEYGLADTNNRYPEGSIVRVQFAEKEETDKIILYAEQLELIDTE